MDHQGRAYDDEQITGKGFLLRTLHRAERHGLAKGDRRGLDHAATGPAFRQLVMPHKALFDYVELVPRFAVEATGIGAVAVQLDHLVGGYA